MKGLAIAFAALVSSTCAQYMKTPASPRYVSHKAVPRQAGNQTSNSWPYAPFSTRGRDIVNARGEVVTWAGVNWPMSGTFNI